VLSHGAGNGIEARDLAALAAALPGQGFTVALFEQAWRVAGRRIATAPPTLDAGLTAAVEQLAPSAPFVVGGRSAGARSAARCALRLGADGCLALAFPLHPPGRPEKSRLGELTGAGVPTLVVQGERDPMGTPEEFPEAIDLAVVPAADHGLKVPRSGPLDQEGALDLVVESTLEWLVREVVGNP
jgi:predicted alpha/beta-hydrolase family hydrolase